MSSNLQQIKLYATIEEKKQIQKDAASAGLSVSQYVLNVVTNKKVTTNSAERQAFAKNTCKMMNLVRKYITDEQALNEFKELEAERWQLLK